MVDVDVVGASQALVGWLVGGTRSDVGPRLRR